MLIKLLLLYGLPILYELLYKWLSVKFGPSLMRMASTNVAMLAQHRKAGMTSEQAERENVERIQQATRQSPSITASDAKLINLAAYAKYVKDNEPEKFKEWIARADKWFATRHLRDEVTFSMMGLYVNPPDREKAPL